MPSMNDRYSSYSSSSFSSSSSSSQLSTPRAFHSKILQNLASPRLSTTSAKKSPLWDVEKANCSDDCSTPPKSTDELKTEIAELETEILQLERYLLSLYRTSFGDHLPTSLLDVSRNDSSLCLKTPPPSSPDRINHKSSAKFHNQRVSSVSQTSISCRRSLCSTFRSSSSQMENMKRSDSGNLSLAELLGVSHMIDGLNTPNKLSEEIVRLMSVIYLNLSENGHSRLVNISKSICLSSNEQSGDMNEQCELELGVVIHKLCLDEDNLKSVESKLQNFRSLVQRLEKIDPVKMTREEKLAFWINIHNALVMHAYIVYGYCERKTTAMILKGAYNIGGKQVNAYDIQSSIFGIHAGHSASRFRTLFSPTKSSKASNGGHSYALDYAEPLLRFALSTGASTDPMVQCYTAGGIFKELRQAREVFIRTNVRFEKERKILLPKIFYNYGKDASLDMSELFNTISGCLPETQRKTMTSVVKKKQEGRFIRWIDQDSNFRYVIHGELLRGNLGI